MNRLSVSEPPKNYHPICAELTKMAERELAAFVSAVTELFGQEQAKLSAEDWMRELMAINRLPASTREWRRISVNVAARLANRVQGSSVPIAFPALAQAGQRAS